MQHRRSFLKKSIALTTALPIFNVLKSFASSPIKASKPNGLIVSTWDAGIRANAAAWKIIGNNGTALDAVEAGVKITELENNCCVGLNGRPDRDGFVTLDACIMDDKNRCGSVAMLQKIKHPISVARAVMEKTPHVILVGDGAYQFAIKNGFKKVIQNTGLLGRWQQINSNPKTICDTAHNAHGLAVVMSQLKNESFENLHLVLGFVNDKDLDKILPLFPKNAQYYFSKPSISRGLDEKIVQEKAAEFGLIGTAYNSISEAYKAAQKEASKKDFIYIGGSTFTVAEVL